MNFVAALVLLVVDDEPLAWTIFDYIMKKNGWRRHYLHHTPKLFEVTK